MDELLECNFFSSSYGTKTRARSTQTPRRALDDATSPCSLAWVRARGISARNQSAAAQSKDRRRGAQQQRRPMNANCILHWVTRPTTLRDARARAVREAMHDEWETRILDDAGTRRFKRISDDGDDDRRDDDGWAGKSVGSLL